MQIKSLRCPNCNGTVRSMGEGKFVCESCGTSFVADYDKEDVEYEKARARAEHEKMQFERQKAGMQAMQDVRRMQQNADKRMVIIMIAGILIFASMVTVFGVVVGNATKSARDSYAERKEQMAEQQSKQREMEREAQRLIESQERAIAEQEAKFATLETYDVTPAELMADEFFVENARAALVGQLSKNVNLVWTNYSFDHEPEYITSYLLIADDAYEKDHNLLINVYKVTWNRERGDGEIEQYVMYDGACLSNLSLKEDGSVQTNYSPFAMTWHTEIPFNQFFSGYSDYDQLIRQEIYGRSGYRYEEFKFPEAETNGASDEDAAAGNE